jgi:predicted outer membrane repeat protein
LQPVRISGSRVSDNRTGGHGGGLFAQNGIALTISGSTFSGNQAADSGGGLACPFGDGASRVDLTVTGSVFANNSAGFSVGAILALSSGQISISSSVVTGNTTTGNGGGIYAESTATVNGVLLKNVTVSGNSAGALGGGLVILSSPDFHITGGSFMGNRATYGGGIGINGSSGTIIGTPVSGNFASLDGGGIDQLDPGTVTLQIAKVHGNTAPTGPELLGNFTLV